jgi:hypothetical protein
LGRAEIDLLQSAEVAGQTGIAEVYFGGLEKTAGLGLFAGLFFGKCGFFELRFPKAMIIFLDKKNTG